MGYFLNYLKGYGLPGTPLPGSQYGKCFKTLFSFPFQNFVIRAGIHKMIVRIANREDPDQTTSSEAV